ncbi:MAG: tyrosine--tRNA ligase [Candidatus Omnitrophota bacterium]
MKTPKEQLDIIRRGTVEIIQESELLKKLEKNKPLVIKAGFDPTVSDIHLGHTVLLRKLKHFQELGHKVIFLIGDATALIGDPSGQSKTRKTLSWNEVKSNAETYQKQVGKILDIKSPKVFKKIHNSDWFTRSKAGKPGIFDFDFFTNLAKKYTVARLLERDDFQKRLKENKPITFLELFYPLMQGYDSVKLKADVEIGGTDQKFNMLVGRNLQESYGQDPQIVITMPLLEGTDGVDKMSKSLGNYIGINEAPKDIFGKIMSISDELMNKYYELLTDESLDKIKTDLGSGKLHPKTAKKNLAKYIIKDYHSQKEANAAEANFEKAFTHKQFPDDIALVRIETDQKSGPLSLLNGLSMVTKRSKSELRRKIEEGAVEINGAKNTDIKLFAIGSEYKIRIGKSFFRVIFE